MKFVIIALALAVSVNAQFLAKEEQLTLANIPLEFAEGFILGLAQHFTIPDVTSCVNDFASIPATISKVETLIIEGHYINAIQTITQLSADIAKNCGDGVLEVIENFETIIQEITSGDFKTLFGNILSNKGLIVQDLIATVRTETWKQKGVYVGDFIGITVLGNNE